MRRIRSAASIALAVALAAAPAVAEDDVAAFYRGKTLTITNAFAEGGLYANLARIIAHHLPRHVPGNPTWCHSSCPAPPACDR